MTQEISYQPIPPLSSFEDFDFPIKNDRYEISAGLKKIEDHQIFLHNQHASLYLAEKKKCLEEDPEKYFCIAPGFEEEIETISNFIGPHDFHQNCMNRQEDMAIIKGGYNIAIHLSFPNHWNPNSKIGKSFFETHLPVADFEPINKTTSTLLNACVNRSPFERYAWGISSDTRLNHHPLPPPQMDYHEWAGRNNNGKLYMRVERQTIKGFPQLDSFLFTIFTFFVDLESLTPMQYNSLIKAVDTMTEETLYYKGINRDDLISYRKE